MADDVDVDSIETFTNDKKVIIAKASKQFEKPDNTEMNNAQVFYFMDVDYIYCLLCSRW
ncbi:MAG TPA: hypothetical protein GXZ76_03060 [Clostridiaceae bacterium]|nr:hypothetical protein [Clostridiaceae bacterium]